MGENQFLQGGLWLMILGGVLASLRRWPASLWQHLRDRFSVTVTTDSPDDAYWWLLAYAADRLKSTRSFRARALPDRAEPGAAVPYWLEPSGEAWFRWEGRPAVFRSHQQDSQQLSGINLEARQTKHTVSVTLLFAGRAALERLLVEGRRLYRPSSDRTQILMPGFNGWQPLLRLPRRPLESVVLPDGVLEGLVADLRRFLDSREWYESVGVPWRRGYLLASPPGCGKTSLVKALASHFDADLAYQSLDAGAGSLTSSLATVGRRFVLVEDVDCYGHAHERKPQPLPVANPLGEVAEVSVSRRPPTLAELLNALDGAVACEGRVVFLTTNHPDRLDPALLRPGRVDVRIDLGPCDVSQARRLAERFCPDNFDVCDAVADWGVGRTPAEIQGHLLKHRDRWDDLRPALEAVVPVPYDSGYGDASPFPVNGAR